MPTATTSVRTGLWLTGTLTKKVLDAKKSKPQMVVSVDYISRDGEPASFEYRIGYFGYSQSTGEPSNVRKQLDELEEGAMVSVLVRVAVVVPQNGQSWKPFVGYSALAVESVS